MSNDGGRLALAILMLLVAMVLFFFAFHPGGVATANNPADILQYLFGEFNATAGGQGGAASTTSPTAQFEPTPSGSASTNQQLTE